MKHYLVVCVICITLQMESTEGESQTPEECQACLNAVFHHPVVANLRQRVQKSTSSNLAAHVYGVDPYKATYIIYGLILEHCLVCSKESFEDYSQRKKEAENQIIALGSEVPELPSDFVFRFSTDSGHPAISASSNATTNSTLQPSRGASSLEERINAIEQKNIKEGSWEIETGKPATQRDLSFFATDNAIEKKNMKEGSWQIETVKPAIQKDLTFPSTDAGSEKIDEAKIIKDEVLKKENQMKEAKRHYEAFVDEKLNAIKSDARRLKSCIPNGIVEYMVTVAENESDLNPMSLEESVPWSQWKQFGNSALLAGSSKKKHCKVFTPLDALSALVIIKKGSDDFFDYAFYRLQNNSSDIIAGRLELITKDENNKMITSSERFYLEPFEKEESLGNWVIGCEILSIRILEYCSYTNKN